MKLALAIAGAAVWALVWSGRRPAAGESGAESLARRLARERTAASKRARDPATLARLARQRRAAAKRREGLQTRFSDCCAAPDDAWRSTAYKAWKAPDPVDFAEAHRRCFAESVQASLLGDYSKPADRRCALGKMHEAKLSQWVACRRGCGRGIDDLYETPEGDWYLSRPGKPGLFIGMDTSRGLWFVARGTSLDDEILAGPFESRDLAIAAARAT